VHFKTLWPFSELSHSQTAMNQARIRIPTALSRSPLVSEKASTYRSSFSVGDRLLEARRVNWRLDRSPVEGMMKEPFRIFCDPHVALA
jgi:hypothetical protein